MSMLHIIKAFKTPCDSSGQKLVLIKLADNANDEGYCWPSYQYIADHCGMNRRTVIRYVKALEKKGVLSVERRRKDNESNHSNMFKLIQGSDGVSLGGGVTQSLGGDTETLGGSDTVSPRTYHSLESTKEPINSSIDEAFDYFWINSGLVKSSKQKAKSKFKTLVKKENDPLAFAGRLVRDCQERQKANQFGFDRLHATTYLNNERWEDEVRHEANQPNNPQSSGTGRSRIRNTDIFAGIDTAGTSEDQCIL